MTAVFPWRDECLATAAAVGVTVDRVEVGAHNVVLLAADSVLRFPIREREAEQIEQIAARHRRAWELGLRAPEVEAFSCGPPGTAHVRLRRVEGVPFSTALAEVDDSQRRRALDDVTALLAAVRAVSSSEWPFVAEDWVALWAGLPERIERLAQLLPGDALPGWRAAAGAAAAVAASAPLGLLHGDLQDPNLRVDRRGELRGVLDWDTALIGDPAMDTAAVLHSAGPDGAEQMLAGAPWLREDMVRFAVYRATWEAQAALWQAGDDHWLFTAG